MHRWLLLGSACALGTALACNSKSHAAAHPSVASATPSAAASAAPATGAARGCIAAKGTEPMKLGTVLGDVFGFGQDADRLYYTSWQVYSRSGDVGVIRKDGASTRTLASLELQPRGLAVGPKNLYYTSGIHLLSVPKTGGTPRTLVDVFSSQAVALGGSDVYGVPGDYGPYDRLAKVSDQGGDVTEIASDKRPKTSASPTGYSRVLVDGSIAYITDSGNDRVLAFSLPKGKRKVLVSHVKQPWDLAMSGNDLYFSLANTGELMSVPKSGGPAKRVASGLVKNAVIAADARGVVAAFAGPTDDAPEKLSEVSPAGKVTPVATIPANESVSALAVDNECVYWVVTVDATQSVAFAAKAAP
jgi:hypothetical protein